MKVFKYNLKVYYEDTDFGGVVYHSNYLNYFERARSELIYSLGFSNKYFLEKYNIFIAVKTCKIDFKKPAKFEDKLTVYSIIKSYSPYTVTMNQYIKRKAETLCDAEIKLVSISKAGKLEKFPKTLIKKLAN